MLALDLPAEATLRTLFSWLRTEVLGTRRRDIARLVLTEAHRFPELAEIYHREVVGRGLRFIRTVAARAVERGEFRSDQIVRFPQLVIAPALVALIWSNLFARLEPLDTEGLFDAHLELLMRALREGAP